MLRAFKITGLFLILALFSSCSSTMLLSSWTKQDYTPQKYDKILVLAIGKTTSGRAIVESAMVNKFLKQGFNAVSTVDVFPAYNPDVKLDQDVVNQKLNENHIDGVLMLSILDVKSEQVYVEGQTYTQAVGTTYNPSYGYQPGYSYHPNGYNNQYYPYYNNSYGYYSTVYETVHEPGYYEEHTDYYLESNFYNVSTGVLTWSGQCKSMDPTDIGTAANEWAATVVNAMKADQVFPK